MPAFQNVIMPDTGTELLREELALAFAGLGLRVFRVHPADLWKEGSEHSLASLREYGPALFFSVNFQGLGELKNTVEYIERTGGAVAVWCVDNPWNVLSAVKTPVWKRLPLFVTDGSFIPGLQAHGAERVYCMPLAACPELFRPNARRDAAFRPPPDLAPLVFVGRTGFPGKDSFFANIALPQALLEQAVEMANGTRSQSAPDAVAGVVRPDFLWWQRQLPPAPCLWPGKKARVASYGAELCTVAARTAALGAVAAIPADVLGCSGNGGNAENKIGESSAMLDIFGDAGWQELLEGLGSSGQATTGENIQKKRPAVRLFPPVDYYAHVPGIYRSARYSLTITSLQLPSGLNQRHFDVWASGGCCLSDNTPGLALFPRELTEPVTWSRPADIPGLVANLEKSHTREELIRGWQQNILEKHTYTHRVQGMLQALGR